MYNSPQQRIQRLFSTTGAPATIILIAINVISFFCGGALGPATPFRGLLFIGALWPHQVWTALTWPLVGGGHPFALLMVCAWAFWVCGSLERSWGTRTFLGFFFASAALMALSVWAGGHLLGYSGIGLAGLQFAIAAPTVAWCVLNSRETINLYGVLPIPAPWILALTLVIVWFELGAGVIGLFGLIPCGVAYAYARYGRTPWRGYAPARPNVPPLRFSDPDRVTARGPFGWFRARREQRKLEKLWKNSTKGDD